jgi:hypothetical protein
MDDSDIHDAMEEDKRRGRRPIDLRVYREHQKQLSSIRKYLRLATEEEFVKAMLNLGLSEEHEAFSVALQAWREFRE